MSTAALSGATVASARVQVPAFGVWWADVGLTSPTAFVAGEAGTLTLGDIDLVGTVVDGGVADGRAAYRIAGGAGGWGRVVEERSYQNDAGVSISLVVGDVAADVGETVSGASGTTSRHYVRSAEPASFVLHRLFPRGWHVDFAGTTQIGLRSETTYQGAATRTRRAPGAGVIDIAATEISSLVPGVIVDDAAPATDVEYLLEGGRLTARVYAGAKPARRLAAWEALFNALDPQRRYRGVYEYRVVSQSGDRLNLQVVRTSTGLPDLTRVQVCGPYGVRATAILGAVVKIAFADADPSRPFVIAGPAWDDPGWLPDTVMLGGSGESLALASLVADEFGVLKDAISNAATGGSDGGATFKTNILLALNLPAYDWPQSVASARVETDS